MSRERSTDGGAIDWDSVPCLTLEPDEDALERVLRTATSLLLAHPALMQSVFTALVAEGRRFATTGEGRRWRDALADSDLVRSGRAIWEASSFKLLEDAPVVLPSAIVDVMVYAATQPDLYERLPGLAND